MGRNAPVTVVIEDDEATRATFTRALRTAGLSVYSVATHREAITALDAMPSPAVVVVDVSLGKAAVADALRLRAREPRPRLIALTDRSRRVESERISDCYA